MDSLIYVHHHGQFLNPDLEDKVPLNLNERIYLQVVHDVSL